MAGDWIKLETTTPDKPEVFQMADELGMEPDEVVGRLIRIWIWADQQTFNGHAGSVTVSLLNRVSGVTGFADAMVSCGWLARTDDGLTLPNFERHNGNTAKTRGLSTKRKQRERANVSRSVRDSSVTREEKRREENTIPTSSGNDGAASGQSTGKKPASNTKARRYTADFDQWWAAYWNTRGKSAAAKAFTPALARIVDDPEIPDATDTQTALTWLIDRTQRYASQLDEATEKLHGATYLNQDRYQDDLEPRRLDRGAPMQQPLSRRRFAQ